MPKTKKTLLIIDDDRIMCETVMDFISGPNLNVVSVHTGAEGINLCSRGNVDIVLLDQNLPDAEGYNLCGSILEYNNQAKIIFITAFPSFDNAVRAIKAGAHDYLSKPFELEELKLAIDRAVRTLELENVEQLQYYRNSKELAGDELVGLDGGLAGLIPMIDAASSSDSPVLITGETGTGKNAVARAIHLRRHGGKKTLININCAALPETLIEDELFGHERGAFTGAVESSKGIFELAEGGTLVLDEIGDMPIRLQSKLLSVIEEKKIKKLGGESFKDVNARIITTTNVELERAVSDNTFRRDLFYRLSVISIHVSPLRERRGDIPELCGYLLGRIGSDKRASISDAEMERLMAYDWPGNVRELRNILERAVLLHKGGELKPSEFIAGGSGRSIRLSLERTKPDTDRISTLEEMEQSQIESALRRLSGNYTRTAKALGVSLSTLKRKVREYGIHIDPK